MNSKTTSAIAVVALLVLATLAPMAVSAEPANLNSNAPNTADAGDEVTVSFSLTNTGDNDSAYILNVDQIPDGWEIVDRQDDGGSWKSSNTRWLYQTINPGETRNPSLTLKIPNDEDTGSYTISAEAKDNDQGVRDTTSETINVQGPTPTPTQTPTTPTPEPTPTPTFAGGDDDDDDQTATPTPQPGTATPPPVTPTPSDTPPVDDGTPTPSDTPPVDDGTPTPTPTDEPDTPSETPDGDDGISTFLILLIVLILIAVAAGVAYYALEVQE